MCRAAINRRYAEAGAASPAAGSVVGDVLRGLARLRDDRPRRAKALRDHHLIAILELCPGTPIGLRDAALLSVGFAAALRRSELCGLRVDPEEFSAHSLRAGFVTSAAAHHARLDKIMEVTRHRSADMVMRYVRDANAFSDHAGAAFL